METKILISILISLVLLVSVGIVMAHGTDRNSDSSNFRDMTEMMNGRGMSMHMNGTHDMGDMPEEMEEMMGDEMYEEMYEMMGEVWNNETLREEMSEHMRSCPMMKSYYSS